MSKSVENLFYGAPDDATHARDYKHGVDFYKRENGRWLYADKGSWKVALGTSEKDCVERPQPKPWSGPEDGLPPVGTRIEYGSDENGWHEVNVIGYFRQDGELNPICQYDDNGPLCMGSKQYWRAIPTREQLRESAIRDVMDIAQVDCRVTAARLVDAGFKREVV